MSEINVDNVDLGTKIVFPDQTEQITAAFGAGGNRTSGMSAFMPNPDLGWDGGKMTALVAPLTGSPYTWECPAGVNTIEVHIIAGGGGGGVAAGTNGTHGGSGGGAGGAGIGRVTVVPGETYQVSVGGGGIGAFQPAASAPGGNGYDGAGSFFNHTTLDVHLSAAGGAGGEAGSVSGRYRADYKTHTDTTRGVGGGTTNLDTSMNLFPELLNAPGPWDGNSGLAGGFIHDFFARGAANQGRYVYVEGASVANGPEELANTGIHEFGTGGNGGSGNVAAGYHGGRGYIGTYGVVIVRWY